MFTLCVDVAVLILRRVCSWMRLDVDVNACNRLLFLATTFQHRKPCGNADGKICPEFAAQNCLKIANQELAKNPPWMALLNSQ